MEHSLESTAGLDLLLLAQGVLRSCSWSFPYKSHASYLLLPL